MAIELNSLERRVMDMLLAGDDPVLEVLREQYRARRSDRATFDRHRFYLDFAVPPQAKWLEGCDKRITIGDLHAGSKQLPYRATFVLFVDDGAIAFLEGVTYGLASWPDNTDDFEYPMFGIKLSRRPGCGGEHLDIKPGTLPFCGKISTASRVARPPSLPKRQGKTKAPPDFGTLQQK